MQVAFNNDFLVAGVPRQQLLKNSFIITAPDQKLCSWSRKDHSDSFSWMQRITQGWETDQFLIYGKVGSKPFTWEIVPYEKCRTFIGRAIQQLQVLWRSVFGGLEISEEEAIRQCERYRKFPEKTPIPSAGKGTDPFCKEETIERQWVITGEKVNVLFNYAPIGFGGERLHFLVVPKEHRESFTEVTEEEYLETMELTSRLISHLGSARTVYLLNKTGIDAGQTVKHWHLHVIFSSNPAQDFWGKMTVVRNILFGSSPMREDELQKKVAELRNLL